MNIDLEHVKRISHLARLEISPLEEESYLRDLSRIFKLVAELDETTDLSQIEPLLHPLENESPLRPDQVTEPNLRDLIQKNAPAVEAGLYLVPKVIE